MRISLVTGCAGFIGSKVAELLLEQGQSVVGIDSINDYYDIELKEHRLTALHQHSRFQFRKLNIENLDELDQLFSEHEFSVVLNLAARVGVRCSLENPHVYMTTNAMGSLNLLECMRRHGIGKFVLASTSSLYAGQEMPFDESQAVNTPISPYAASKKSAEAMAYSYHYLYGIDVSVVRFFSVYGPAGRPDMSIFRFIRWIDEEIKIELFGDGTQSRDFTYIGDIARGTIAATKPVGFEIINLGSGQYPVSLNQVIGDLEEMLGKKARISRQPFHKADIKSTWAEIAMAEKLLGWKPQVSLADGLQKSVDWYRDNKPWSTQIRLP